MGGVYGRFRGIALSVRDLYFYIDFKIGEASRLERLKEMFYKIKEVKEIGEELLESDEEFDPFQATQWTDYLDDQALEWFLDTFDFHSEEGKTYHKLWNLTKPEVRIGSAFFHLPGNWDFDSMLHSLFHGEYQLIDIQEDKEGFASLYFDPYAGPFGGTEPLVALIESFGHEVIYDYYHDGPHYRIISTWDYKLAKELVAQGKGYSPGL